MSLESFSPNIDDEEIRQQVSEATSDADPTTYSILPPDEMRTKLIRPLNEYNLPVRTGEGETYYELSDLHDPRGQQVVARMLKGVMNVSDVITVPSSTDGDKYYSWKTPLNKIESESTKEDVEAEQLLLQYIFNSKDHRFNSNSNWANNGRYENGKLAHFDFGEDAYKFLETPTGRDGLLSRLQFMSPETINNLRTKVAELETRFEGESGKEFFQSIINATEGPTTELFGPEEVFEKHADIPPLDLLHTILIGRIRGLKNALDNIESSEQ